ncbi:fimbrial biogenesis chaperone [Photobacterium damselae]|uniref:fimbrial biogenesis chaperone n=1 Tax=Photobacterium damselae TaxID=38293 RepID=UPI001C63B4DB|nr:molecular chaperone [Photobacterium damselae]
MFNKLIVLFMVFFTFSAKSGVAIIGSRVIYNERYPKQTISVYNLNDYPVLIQSWIDNGDVDTMPDHVSQTPLIVSNPVFRLAPKEKTTIRIIKIAKMKIKQEEQYFLNFYEVPPIEKKTNDDNSLLVTMRTQFKLFYRSNELGAKLLEPLDFKFINNELTVINKTPYFVVAKKIIMSSNNGKTIEKNVGDLFPYAKINLGKVSLPVKAIQYIYLDDDGNDVFVESNPR